MMNDQLSDEQNEAILKALNEAIEKGPWDKSNFLKVIGKNLIEVRDNFLKHSGADSLSQSAADRFSAHRRASQGSLQEIFVSLYSSDGANVQSWEKIIANLPKQMISRPIYANEEDVIELIKTKENKLNEAYVAVYISESDILSLPPEKSLVDKLGKELLSLKDKTISLDNISKVVHINGTYSFVNNRLVRK